MRVRGALVAVASLLWLGISPVPSAAADETQISPTLTLAQTGPFSVGDVVSGIVEVLDEDDAPVQGAVAAPGSDGCVSWPAATSDANGNIAMSFTIRCTDEISVEVSSPDGSDVEDTSPVEVDMSPLATPTLTLALAGPFAPGEHVAGTIHATDQRGKPVPGATVAGGDDGCVSWDDATAGASGLITLEFTISCDDDLAVDVSTPDGSDDETTTPVHVEITALTAPTLSLSPAGPYAYGAVVTGTIKAVDQNGDPLPGAVAMAHSSSCASWAKGVAGADGVITLAIAVRCTTKVAVEVSSGDGSDERQTNQVQIQIVPLATPVLGLAKPGPYADGAHVAATVQARDQAGHPLPGASVPGFHDSCVRWGAGTADSQGEVALTLTVTCNDVVSVEVLTPGKETSVHGANVTIRVRPPLRWSVPQTSVRRPFLTMHVQASLPGLHADFGAPHVYIQTSHDAKAWTSVMDLGGYLAPKHPEVWFAHAGVNYVRFDYAGTKRWAQTATRTVRVDVGHAAVPLWLRQFNHYRAVAGVGPVGEDPANDAADAAHVKYMTETGEFGHYEDHGSRYYTALGERGGTSSELYDGLSPTKVVASWLSTPYHQIGMLEANLYTTGFAHRGAYTALYVFGQTQLVRGVTAPQVWPRRGGYTPILHFAGNEIPDPLVNCPARWQEAPTGDVGPGLIAFAALAGHQTATFYDDGRSVPVCLFTESYGDQTLDHLMPLRPLRSGHRYKVVIRSGQKRLAWSFHT